MRLSCANRAVHQANEAYALKGVRIPELVLSSTFANALELDPSCNHSHSRQNRTSTYKFDGPCLDELRSSQFTKSDLRNGVVLGQVDRKFIACVINPRLGPEPSRTRGRSDDDDAPNEESLVLIDQHAAHERVRVEMLMETLCCGGLKASQDDNGHQDVGPTPGPKRRTLEPPVMILLTKHEAERLSDSSPLQAAFATWGLDFIGLEAMAQREECTGLFARVVGVDEGGSGYAQVSVKSVPEVVADKVSEYPLMHCKSTYQVPAPHGGQSTRSRKVIYFGVGITWRSSLQLISASAIR